MKRIIWCVGCSFTEGVWENQFTGWPSGLQERTRSTVINLGVGGSGIEYHSWCVNKILELDRPRDTIVVCQTDHGRFTTWDDWDITDERYHTRTADLALVREPPVDCITYSSPRRSRLRRQYYAHVRDEHMRWSHSLHSQFIHAHADFVFKHTETSAKSTHLPCYQTALSQRAWQSACVDQGNHLTAEGHRLEGHWVYDQLVARGTAV